MSDVFARAAPISLGTSVAEGRLHRASDQRPSTSLGTSGLWVIAPLLALLALLLPSAAQAKPKRAPVRPAVTILISIDGFRSDYLQRGVSPTLSALAKAGVTGPMRQFRLAPQIEPPSTSGATRRWLLE